MTTPSIEELIAKLRTSMGDLDCPNTYEFAMHQAADALQSQAERISMLESLNELAVKQAETLVKQRDTLRAEIAAIDATEPIARAMSDKTNTGYVYVKVLADKLQFGTNLYSHPMPAQGVEDAARYRWLRDYLISPSTHFDDLIVSADKAETLNGVIDAARAKGAK
jgi:hypothetical protein